jgi:SAM-dependent methyltransferase
MGTVRLDNAAPVYVSPLTGESLRETEAGLVGSDGSCYRYLKGWNDTKIPDFVCSEDLGETGKKSLEMYNQAASVQQYRNFLKWLFDTFREDEADFRRRLLQKAKIQPGDRVLITGCGLGDDLPFAVESVGRDGEVYAQDLSAQMVLAASMEILPAYPNSAINFSVSDAAHLPFSEDFFDAAYHFGGINLFDDIGLAIREMERVVKTGGRVVFGDEGVAPWLKNRSYGRIAINNNSLWRLDPPLDLLPEKVIGVELTWVLGNCFYVISFEVSDTGPYINLDIPHKSPRGGSMRTRYFGTLDRPL